MSTTLHDLIRGRWSPNDFSTRPIEPEKLRTVFEAARWAASCFNEQPWRFIVATNIPDDFEVGAAFAIGYIDETTTKPGVRTRKELEEIVFAGDWGAPAPL